MEDNALARPSATIGFPGQREGEEIKFILRRHKIAMLGSLAYLFFLVFLPLGYYSLLIPYTFSAFLQDPYDDVFFLTITIYYGFLWIITFIEWIDYYLDIWIITDQRILEIEQKSLFHRVISEMDLKRVQDITSTIEGPWQTFFSYGDIRIQTASEENIIKLKQVPHPVTVRRTIMELCRAAQEKPGWGISGQDS